MADDKLTVLLIEDSLADAFLLQELLAIGRSRLKLLHAERLKDGLEHLRRGSIDVVLLDLSLPDAYGIETVTQTHATSPDVAIVVLTGLDDEATAIRAMHEGAQDYLVKGQVDRNLLIRAIRYARERKRTEETNHRLVREQAARASAEAAERRARFLAEASRTLASSLDFDTTLSTVAGLAVPVVADCCLVDLLQESGQVRRVAAISPDGGGSPELWREEPSDLPEAAGPVGQALRQGEATVLTELTEPVYRSLRLPDRWEHLHIPRSASIVPMLARGRILGAMTFLTWHPERHQGQESLVAMELAGLAALAVDNARLYRAREQILEVVSHDLRTPLTTMVGNIALIRDLKAPPQGPLEVISRAAQHMSQLVEDLLDMSRLEGGTFSLERRPMDVKALLDEVLQMMRPGAEGRGLQLHVAAASGLPAVQADRRRVLQVLWNLVGNGLKFSPAGGRVEVRAVATDRALRIEVADNGPGIQEKELPHVFERFWQGGILKRRGVGLGLSIAKAIVEAHGGKIGVSTSPSGTTFFFTLPFSAPGK
jgi:signal transduction histidine kinase/DNA-binding NarL/FixJ family response regulator